MSRHGEPTGWRRAWEDCVAVGLALYEMARDAFRRSAHRCAKCGRPAAGRHPLTRTLRCRRHL